MVWSPLEWVGTLRRPGALPWLGYAQLLRAHAWLHHPWNGSLLPTWREGARQVKVVAISVVANVVGLAGRYLRGRGTGGKGAGLRRAP